MTWLSRQDGHFISFATGPCRKGTLLFLSLILNIDFTLTPHVHMQHMYYDLLSLHVLARGSLQVVLPIVRQLGGCVHPPREAELIMAHHRNETGSALLDTS